jgi:hypothetical protein
MKIAIPWGGETPRPGPGGPNESSQGLDASGRREQCNWAVWMCIE